MNIDDVDVVTPSITTVQQHYIWNGNRWPRDCTS